MSSDDDVEFLYEISRPDNLSTIVADTSQICDSQQQALGSYRRQRANSKWTIPHHIRNKSIRLGGISHSISEEPWNVFGLFDIAGRFCRRVGHLCPTLTPVKHEDIEYREMFSGLSRDGVKEKVLQYLLSKYGQGLAPGEI